MKPKTLRKGQTLELWLDGYLVTRIALRDARAGRAMLEVEDGFRVSICDSGATPASSPRCQRGCACGLHQDEHRPSL